MYARIDLSQTDYPLLDTAWSVIQIPDPDQLNEIYKKYCRYKKFNSVMPIFDSEYIDQRSDVIGYWHNDRLVAFSLMRRYDYINVEAVQFAWDYAEPKLGLGIASLKNECAYYKQRGFQYLYLGGADEYKQQIAGFELIGPA